jgi:hypothetical protein
VQRDEVRHNFLNKDIQLLVRDLLRVTLSITHGKPEAEKHPLIAYHTGHLSHLMPYHTTSYPGPRRGIHRRLIAQKTKSFALSYSQLRISLDFTPGAKTPHGPISNS